MDKISKNTNKDKKKIKKAEKPINWHWSNVFGDTWYITEENKKGKKWTK